MKGRFKFAMPAPVDIEKVAPHESTETLRCGPATLVYSWHNNGWILPGGDVIPGNRKDLAMAAVQRMAGLMS